MTEILERFEKKKEFLVCVDSDGCAMNTMDIKHMKCFGPCVVEEWGLEEWREDILKCWNEMNLYSITRGINRFKGLEKILEEVNKKYKKIEGIKELKVWIENAKELSNQSIEEEFERTRNSIFKKGLIWSNNVNQAINQLKESEKQPFLGVQDALKTAKKKADIAVVSSANLQAVKEEWERHRLIDDTDVILSQNIGSKTYAIRELLKKGYKKEHVIMVGDALGDQKAAEENGVCFFPILVKKEKESWKKFQKEAFPLFLEDNYKGEYQQKQSYEFLDNLSKGNLKKRN